MSRKSKAAEFIGEGYNMTITGRNVEVTEAMKNYALEKVAKMERYTDRIIDFNIIMDIQKLEHRVDLVIKINNIKIKSHAVTNDMYASIDLAVHKLEAQLLKYKARLQDHHARNLASIDMNVNVLALQDHDEFSDEIDNQSFQDLANSFSSHRVVSQEKRPLHFLTMDEAVTKIELSGDNFLIFRSEEDRRLKVIYRRHDSNFGVIEVEA